MGMNSTLAVPKEEMTEEFETPRVRGFVATAWPWLLGCLMFAVFLSTLSRWVNPLNLNQVADLAGWNQSPQSAGAITLLVTAPLRKLPPNLIPLALNLFSALCGALALCLLARSVALLPHDRTHEQRERERSEFSLLSTRTAWLPPLFAVLVCGLQLTFWQQATVGSSEIFDLLIFAYVIRCLLEYRISGEESWLTKFAFVYGLGMADNWAMIGFFPGFLAAVIWIKGLGAFNPRFIVKTFCLGLSGFLLIFLLPVLHNLFHSTPLSSYWETLRTTISGEKRIFSFFHAHLDVWAVLALTSILPVLVMGIRWSSYFGDNSPLGIFLATSMFHVVHALFLLACLWVALDSPISPRKRGYGLPFLTFYYLGALAVGYLSGYFLLIFGVNKSRNRTHVIVRVLKYCVVGCVWVLLLAVPALMVCINLPRVQSISTASKLYEDYFEHIAKLLIPQPVQGSKSRAEGAVVLCDDPFRASYLQAVLTRENGHTPYLVIDTSRLGKEPAYLGALEKSNPGYELCGSWTNIPSTAPPGLSSIQLLEHLALKHAIYYAQPSFGYFFEKFYPETHGLVYQLKTYPPEVWDVPEEKQKLIGENLAYWKQMFTETLPPVVEQVKSYSDAPVSGVWKTITDKLHLKPEAAAFTAFVGVYYARALDEWGTQLQVSGQRAQADKVFDEALALNPANISAQVNKAMDQQLAQGKKPVLEPAKNVEKSLEQYTGGWTELLRADGPIDNPSFRRELGLVLAQASNYRQAVQEFNRVRELIPDDPRVPFELAQILIDIQTYTNGLALQLPYTQCFSMALTNLDVVLKSYPNDPSALFLKSFALMQMKSYDRAIGPLTQILNQPTQTNNFVAQLNRAIAYFQIGNYDAAKTDYEAVGRVAPRAFQVYYGLGEIAYHEKDKPTAIKNYELYLTNAPANTEESKTVNARLKELKSGAP